jgi:tRNA dimethylallyltransferase
MRKIYIIAGATATGKTAVAVALAKKLGGEIISADSMQIYRTMNIGTAKPTTDEMQNIPHHLIDIVNPDENFSAAQFQKFALQIINEIYSRNKIPIISGGTGFYINALLYGAEFPSETIRQEGVLRQHYFNFARQNGVNALHEKLAAADPEYAATLHPNNVKRVARALAYCETTGEKFSSYNLKQKNKSPLFDAAFFILSMPREILYSRINARTISMLNAGLVEEVRDLLTKGCHRGLASMQGIGYKEVSQFLDGEITHDEMILSIQQSTRNYAKRQETWFRNQTTNAKILFVNEKSSEEIANEILKV